MSENQNDLDHQLASLAGKRITSVAWDWRSPEGRSTRAFGVLTISCDDGTELRLSSYDYEGYSSGIELWDALDEKERDNWLASEAE